MLSNTLFQLYFLAATLCVIATEASIRHGHHHQSLKNIRQAEDGTTSHSPQGQTPNGGGTQRVGTPSNGIPAGNLSVTAAPYANNTISRPSPTQMPLYYICDISELAEANPLDCISTVPPITPSCSTVLQGFFTKVTISDCAQSVTFSTSASYSLATGTGFNLPTATPNLQDRQVPSRIPQAANELSTPKTYLQKIVTYYVSPWQGIADNDPKNITVVTCKTNENGIEACDSVNQVWVKTYSPVTQTSTISVATSFPAPALLAIDPAVTLPVPSGPYNLSTELVHTTSEGTEGFSVQSPNNGTTTVRKTSTMTVTTTVEPEESTRTLTRTVLFASQSSAAVASTLTQKVIITETRSESVTITTAI